MRSSAGTSALALALAGLTSLGCSGPEGESPDEGGGGDLVHRSVVVRGADGTIDVRTETVTRAEIERMKMERARSQAARRKEEAAGKAVEQSAALVLASDCWASGTMWLFDQPSLQGNVLCIRRGSGDFGADFLGNFWRPGFVSTWNGRVRSFWADTDVGYFRLGNAPYTGETYQAGNQVHNVSDTVRNASVLAMTTDLTRQPVTFVGWTDFEGSCPNRSMAFTQGSITSSRTVTGVVDQTQNGERCRYDLTPAVMFFTRNYGARFLFEPTCSVRAFEESLVRTFTDFQGVTQHEWLNVSGVNFPQLHMINGSCSLTHP